MVESKIPYDQFASARQPVLDPTPTEYEVSKAKDLVHLWEEVRCGLRDWDWHNQYLSNEEQQALEQDIAVALARSRIGSRAFS